MALHRDIYWIGRQWSVTGYGLQLIDQRLKGVFDIEIDRLRDQRVLDAMRAHEWLKAEDFDKAIAAAHKRFPERARPAPDEQIKAALPVEMVLRLTEPASSGPKNSPAPQKFMSPVRGLSTEVEIARAELEGRSAPLAVPRSVETPLRSSDPVSAALSNAPPPDKFPPLVPAFPSESELARAAQPGKPAISAQPQLRPSEPAAPAQARGPLSALDLRMESERARADLESKMSALDGLLRSRGFVAAAPPVVPQPSILAVQAEGELAKFAPQWRVRS